MQQRRTGKLLKEEGIKPFTLELRSDIQSTQVLQKIDHGVIVAVCLLGPPQDGSSLGGSFGVEIGPILHQQFDHFQVPSARGLSRMRKKSEQRNTQEDQ